jgi:hypothetical protein
MSRTLSYSHPVLGNADDFTLEWNIETYDEPIVPNNSYGVPVTRIFVECVKTGEDAIDSLLDNNKVALFLELKCLNTCYRRWYPVILSEDHGHVDIQSDHLQGIVKLKLTLEATEEIDGYMPSAISEVYPAGQVFSLKKGDILAQHDAEFSVGEKYVERKLSSVSWIKYRLSQENVTEPQVEYSGSDVVIDMPHEHYQFVTEGADKIDALIRSMYIAPVLANCIEKVRQSDKDDRASDIGGCDWVESLRIQLMTFDIEDDDDAVSAAWIILNGSLCGAIREIASYIEEA